MVNTDAFLSLFLDAPGVDWIAALVSAAPVVTAFIAAIVAARLQLSKIPIERQEAENKDREEDADIVKSYQQIAAAQAIENQKLRQESEAVRIQASKDIDSFRAEMEVLRRKLDERDAEIRDKVDIITARDHIIIDYQDWIKRLRAQVRSLGNYAPVPFRSSYKDVDTQRWADVDRGTGPLNPFGGE